MNARGSTNTRRDFLPFGEELYADGSHRSVTGKYSQTGQDGVRQRFTGYEKDTETGLDFAEARMYENRHGRFTAIDPLLASGKSANPQTFNRYTYVLNNPLLLTDPDGLQAGVATGKVYINEAGTQVRIFPGSPRKGFVPLKNSFETTTTIKGTIYKMSVTPNGWTVGDRVDGAKFEAPPEPPTAKVIDGNPRVQSLVSSVTNQASFQFLDRVTNPDMTAVQFQAPLINANVSVGITRNFDVVTSFGMGRNFAEFKNLTSLNGFSRLVNPRNYLGGLSIQATAILEPERDILPSKRLEFFTNGSGHVGGCWRVCGGMTSVPQGDGSFRKGITWGWSFSPVPSGGAAVNYSPTTWTFNPHRWYFGPDHQNSDPKER